MTRWDELPPHARVRSSIGAGAPAAQAANKYGNDKTLVDGIKFDSVKEADFYCQLKMRRMAGEVKDFDLQVPYELQPSFKRDGRVIRAIRYVADFVISYPDGRQEVIDVKGFRTKEYLLKKKLLLYKYPELDFKEV